jgi:hypothetical protein
MRRKLTRRAARERRALFAVGAIYEDCAYHPYLCTSMDEHDLYGISLVDGSGPRACAIFHCGPEPLTVPQAVAIKANLARYVELRKHLDIDDAIRALNEQAEKPGA